MEQTTIREAEDVTAEALAAAEETSEWFEGRIEWDDFWDRLDTYGYFVPDTDCGAARKIQRHVREHRAGF